MNLYIVLFEGRTGCSFFITFNWCICSLFWRYSDGGFPPWPRLRNLDPFYTQMMLICSIIWLGKRCCGLLSMGSVLRWHEVALCLGWLIYHSVVFTSWCRSINTILRHNWLFDVVWWPPRTLWYVDIIIITYGSFPEKRYQKHRR